MIPWTPALPNRGKDEWGYARGKSKVWSQCVLNTVIASREMTKRPASLWCGGCRQASRHWRRGCRQAVARRRGTGVAAPKHHFYDGSSHNWESQNGPNASGSSSIYRASSSHSSRAEPVLASPCASAARVEPTLCPCCPIRLCSSPCASAAVCREHESALG